MAESEVFTECTEVSDDREWWVEVLESEKESRVSESEALELDCIGEGGAERCFGIFGGGLVGGSPTFLRLLFLVISGGVGCWGGDGMLWQCEGAAPRQLLTEGRRFRGGLLVGAGALSESGENG